MEINNRIFSIFRTAGRGMESQRIALAATTENIANAGTTRTQDGTTYAIKRAAHESNQPRFSRFGQMLGSMRLDMKSTDRRHLTYGDLNSAGGSPEQRGPTTEIVEVNQTRREYDPTHPHADAAGMVEYPDINIVDEMARMISANRLYEANLSSVQAAKEMIKRTFEI